MCSLNLQFLIKGVVLPRNLGGNYLLTERIKKFCRERQVNYLNSQSGASFNVLN